MEREKIDLFPMSDSELGVRHASWIDVYHETKEMSYCLSMSITSRDFCYVLGSRFGYCIPIRHPSDMDLAFLNRIAC